MVAPFSRSPERGTVEADTRRPTPRPESVLNGPRRARAKGSPMSSASGGQQFIRQVNDAIYGVLDKLGVEDGEFWCECANMACEQRVLITLREYAALHQNENGLLISRRHESLTSGQTEKESIRNLLERTGV